MKALLWALYLPHYPELTVEISIGDRYKPDVVALDAQGSPVFWGEAGQVGLTKIRSLLRRHRRTHFAIGQMGVRSRYSGPVRFALRWTSSHTKRLLISSLSLPIAPSASSTTQEPFTSPIMTYFGSVSPSFSHSQLDFALRQPGGRHAGRWRDHSHQAFLRTLNPGHPPRHARMLFGYSSVLKNALDYMGFASSRAR